MIDRFITRIGIGFALFCMIGELSYINAKSLLYIVDKFDNVDRMFAVVGSLAFSCVTVIVMRKSREKWIKIVFPVFDALLVFCGFNLRFADNLLGNPIAFYLTIFMAVFTGIITYSLGIINYMEHSGAKITGVDAELEQEKIKCSNAEAEMEQAKIKCSNAEAAEEMLKQIQKEMDQRDAELDQYKKQAEQIAAACTCEYCGRTFKSEAAKRSHLGKCPEKGK